jgi:hypothetical protein
MSHPRAPVVLVVAPVSGLAVKGFAAQDFLGQMPSLGIRYVAAALEERGYETEVLDHLYSDTDPLRIAVEIADLRPFLVGFSITDATLESTRSTLALLRLIYEGPIVVGGYTPTLHADDFLREWPEIDFVLIREGEQSIVALAHHLDGQRSLDDIPNLAYRDGGEIRFNQEQDLLDVAGLPWPKREWPEPGDVTPILTRRGCTSRCSFCSMVPFYDSKLGPPVRMRQPSDVVDEIADCIDHGSTDFMFYDDCFGLSTPDERTWAEQFLKEVQRRDLHFTWGIELRVFDVIRGESLLRDLGNIGLAHISIGLESMLPRQLKLYNKGYKQPEALKAIEIAKSLPMDFQTNIIFWDPWIRLEEAAEHVDLLDSIGIQEQLGSANFPFYAGLLIARRGTGIHSVMKDAGLLRLRPGSFCEYEYDFVDPAVAAFHKGAYLDFLRRVRAVDRPPALWLSIPRLERAGSVALSSSLRSFAAAVAHAEFDYFRTLLVAACQMKTNTQFERAAQEIHAEYGPRVDACASLLPHDWKVSSNPKARWSNKDRSSL